MHVYVITSSLLLSFRQHKDEMISLKNLISNTSKSRRHRRNILNIIVTILTWVVEFLGFFTVFLGTHIIGHQSNIVNYVLQTFTIICYFIFIPLVYLINGSDFKDIITESNWYGTLLKKLIASISIKIKTKSLRKR